MNSPTPETDNLWKQFDSLSAACATAFIIQSKRLEFERNDALEQIKELKDEKLNNPWCVACREPDCIVSMDGTCEMIRKYLACLKVKAPSAREEDV